MRFNGFFTFQKVTTCKSSSSTPTPKSSTSTEQGPSSKRMSGELSWTISFVQLTSKCRRHQPKKVVLSQYPQFCVDISICQRRPSFNSACSGFSSGSDSNGRPRCRSLGTSDQSSLWKCGTFGGKHSRDLSFT